MKIERSALVAHSAQAMFELVNDVERYPEFIPEIASTRILTQSGNELEAELSVRKGPFTQTFATANTNDPPKAIAMRLKYGPLKHLTGGWQFVELNANACKIIFSLDFEVQNPIAGLAFKKVLTDMSDHMVALFVERADKLAV